MVVSGGELQAELVLGRRHFVVVLFRLEAEFAHHRQHLAAQVLGASRPG